MSKKTVWVVELFPGKKIQYERGQYETPELEGVYATKEAAQAAIDQYEKNPVWKGWNFTRSKLPIRGTR